MNGSTGKRSVAVIGAGLHGLISAKTLIHDSNNTFEEVVVYERSAEAGGVWAQERIYDGLATNSPLLTYEIPGFPYPQSLRRGGVHVKAQDVRKYLHDYAETYGVDKRLRLNTDIFRVTWDPTDSTWVVDGRVQNATFRTKHTHVVVCTGLYHTSLSPFDVKQTSNFAGKIWHSSQIGSPALQSALAESKDVMVVGAGKSALDISTLISKGNWSTPDTSPPSVTLVYRKPHWISPRKIVRNTIPFERLLFSRFVNAWLPYVSPVDSFHYLVADTWIGKLLTAFVFWIVADDFIKSNEQKGLDETIPDYSLAKALSGALHVEPAGYLDSVKSGKISILQGNLQTLNGTSGSVKLLDGTTKTQDVDTIILATGYRLAFPFFDASTLYNLGLIEQGKESIDTSDLPHVHLYRLIVPPKSIARADSDISQPRNIAFNGFAYSLVNPLVAHVTAHWIADYFQNQITIPSRSQVKNEITTFHNWQKQTFGIHGEKGVHIGNHATLYSDVLLNDMSLSTGHVDRKWWQMDLFLEEWFRPMMPHLYSDVGPQRRWRDDTARFIGSAAGKPQKATESNGGFGLRWINALLSLLLGIGIWMVGKSDISDGLTTIWAKNHHRIG